MKVLYNITALLRNKIKLISNTIPISAAMHTFVLRRLISSGVNVKLCKNNNSIKIGIFSKFQNDYLDSNFDFYSNFWSNC